MAHDVDTTDPLEVAASAAHAFWHRSSGTNKGSWGVRSEGVKKRWMDLVSVVLDTHSKAKKDAEENAEIDEVLRGFDELSDLLLPYRQSKESA